MATRNILPVNKLSEFEDFLERKGYMILGTSRNPYEVLRAKKDSDTVIVYQKKEAKEHLSTMDKDYHLVREFIKEQKSREEHLFTDEEYRILLKALSREREVCEKVDRDCGDDHKLIHIMNGIEKKVKEIQYGKTEI